jgi:hypothetical protein
MGEGRGRCEQDHGVPDANHPDRSVGNGPDVVGNWEGLISCVLNKNLSWRVSPPTLAMIIHATIRSIIEALHHRLF